MSLNRVCIQGRFTKDPELKTLDGGNKVVAFTLAVERNRTNKDGNKDTDFIDCVAWGKTAEFICKYMAKGSAATVDGELRVREWKDKNDNNRRTVEVLVGDIFFADSKRKETSSAPQYEQYNEADPDFPF